MAEEGHKLCCLQKFIQVHAAWALEFMFQARYHCCHSADLHGDVADEFSQCCYNRLVWFESDDPCCPRSVSGAYWKERTSMYQLCMPNVDVDWSPVQSQMKMADGTVISLNMALDSIKKIWNYTCPYREKRRSFHFYQPPANDNVDPYNPMEEDKP